MKKGPQGPPKREKINSDGFSSGFKPQWFTKKCRPFSGPGVIKYVHAYWTAPFPNKKFSHVYYFQDSSIYVINGILMMATFFTFRVIFIPMIYFWFASNKSVGMSVALQMIPLKCHLTTLCVWIPQLYWFYKMVNGLQKLLQEQKMSKLKSSWKLSHVST